MVHKIEKCTLNLRIDT